MATPMFRMSLNPQMETEAILDIFDEIGEYEDFLTGDLKGVGPRKISGFLNDHSDVTDIKVRIQSYGGDAFEGISVLNLLKTSGKKVTVEVLGVAASAASVIAMAGEKIVMHPTSQLMIHNCWTLAVGNSKELRKTADDMDKIMESMKAAYLAKAGGKLTADKLQDLLDGETYLTADECLVYGLCDEIDGKTEIDEPEEKTVEDKIQPSFSSAAKKNKWFF